MEIEALQVQIKQTKTDGFDIDELSTFSIGDLPPKFRMPEVPKFKGVGVRLNWSNTRPSWASISSLMSKFGVFFHFSVEEGAAAYWYHGLEKSVKLDWKEMVSQFLKHS